MFTLEQIPCKTPKECKFVPSAASTTLMAYTPVFDRSGKNLNPDGNTTSYSVYCQHCEKSWNVSECLGKKVITEKAA